jgi:predicted TIM-barrel fold metal-dependent hydrolase
MPIDVPVIDAHHHLWDLAACHYPWLLARGVRRFFGDPTPIQRNYLVADFADDAREVPLVGSVHVQVGVSDADVVAETRWLQFVADADAGRGWPCAIVAYCDLAWSEAPAVMLAHLESPNMRGVRQIFGRAHHDDMQERSDALIDEPRVACNLAHAARLGLSFDLQLIPAQAERVARLLDRVPDLRVALCHCGSPWDQSTEGLDAWRRAIDLLAARPQVACKLSGFGMFDPHWTVASLRPIVAHCIERFGTRRCMFGSNFPVEKLARDYSALWNAYDQLTAGCSRAERERLFHGTACEFYRIAPSARDAPRAGRSATRA